LNDKRNLVLHRPLRSRRYITRGPIAHPASPIAERESEIVAALDLRVLPWLMDRGVADCQPNCNS
jgi:hypothetical protein